jgi:phosphoribosyl-ATP pyrophosphohydrolase
VTAAHSPPEDALDRLMRTIVERRDGVADRSYTQRLLAGGVAAIGAKIQEEAGEVVDAALRLESRKSRLNSESNTPTAGSSKELGTPAHLVHEAADLLYHLWVILAKHDISLEQVRNELDRRAGVSGLDEKANRSQS